VHLLPHASCSEVITGAKVLVAAGSAAYSQEVSVAADIQQPRFQLRLEGNSLQHNGVVTVPPLQPGQEQHLDLELINQGGKAGCADSLWGQEQPTALPHYN